MRRFVTVIIITGYALSIVIIRPSKVFSPSIDLYSRTEASEIIPLAPESFIFIPSIKVSAFVEKIEVDSKGVIGSPIDRNNVGMIDIKDTKIINGHSGYRTNSSVFDNLNKLKVGDLITIEDIANKASVSYIVKDMNSYDIDQKYSDILRGDLNLITCDGAWDRVTKNFTKRLVVFADRY